LTSTVSTAEPALAPPPRRLRRTGGALELGRGLRLDGAAPTATVAPAIDRLCLRLEAMGSGLADRGSPLTLEPLAADPTSLRPASPEAYRLDVEPRGIRLRAATEAGLSHGLSTLAQWLALHAASSELPAVRIEDAPLLRHRGVLLDVSRSRVPTMESLLRLVERLASWKINELQLYTEHTFAYRGHEVVWRGASAFTPAEIRRLDHECRLRHIELVPNQNSFGHLHRWLEHDRYRHLAECPDGIEHPFADRPTPFSLCPIDPGSLELLADLYAQLLPCFSSRRFHIGFDETLDLGRGRSRERAEAIGLGHVYADFLVAVARLAAGHGRSVQFWGDIAAGHPEILALTPADATVMEWGYEADHPFPERAAALAAAGRPFYLCPGTSSWLSFAGRWTNAAANIAAAIQHGVRHGAIGVLVTDWGDQGHLQPPMAGLPGYLLTASLAWNPERTQGARPESMRALLDLWAFDSAPGRGPAGALLALADVYSLPGGSTFNASPLFYLLTRPDLALDGPRLRGITTQGLERTRERLGEIGSSVGSAGTELGFMRRALDCAVTLGLARLRQQAGTSCRQLDASSRRSMAGDLDALIEEHRALWASSSRPGGLDESARHLERTRDALRGKG
jgi:hypothetical protein